MAVNKTKSVPFLLRFLEREAVAQPGSSRVGTASNPKEEAPRPEPTKKGPMGD
jgi:hypothetical protein